MMEFNFDEIVDRRHTNSCKWDLPNMQDDVLPMWVADMDFKAAPPIIDALRSRVEHGIFGYVSMPNDYYNSIISWFHRRHNWEIKREWIQYTSGVVPAISVVIKGLTQPGDKVLIMTPVYNCFFSSIRNNGCETVECPLVYKDATYNIDFDLLEECASQPHVKLLLFCNPHNPAGRVWTREELVRVGEICRKHDVLVVSDEIHCEIVMSGHKFTPFASISQEMQDLCITCNSPSKSFNTAGLQIANIICNNAAIQAKIDRAINDNEVCDVNPFGVEALIAAYDKGEPWLNAMCDYVEQNYKLVKQFFETHLPQLTITRLEGTYLVWIDCRSLNKTSDQIIEILLENARVMLNSGTMYGNAGEGFVRLNIATQRHRVEQALHRMLPIFKYLTHNP